MNKLFVIFIFLPLFCLAQKQGNIWYFGNHAGLDFNSGTPVALTDGATYDGTDVGEGTSVISDSFGNLLFYTNGQKIWNRNHQIMPNGDSLLGNYSSTQAGLIIPKPGSSRYFYVFTTDAFQNNLQNGFRYSIVDICLDGGLGDVIQNQKNIKLVDTVAEKQTAVIHSNGVDYWIIVHKYLSDAFYAFQLSSSGIIDTVITHIGSVHEGYCGNSSSSTNAMGSMKASPDGNKLAIVTAQNCNNISELFDFNKSTGSLSNFIKLRTDSIAIGLYGVSFSPDNSKLYITSFINHDRIYQYDLSSGNPITIVNSKIIITNHNGGPWYMAMQLGPDGKLYIAENNQGFMGVIHFPNSLGANCNYEDTTLSLNGKINTIGLPNFITAYDYSNTTFNCSTAIPCPITVNSATICYANSCTLTASGASAYYWSNGATGNSITVSPLSTATYTVTGSNNGCYSTSIATVIVDNPTVTANASAGTVCAGNLVTLTGGGAHSYIWTGGVTDGVNFIPSQTNTYTVIGTDTNNCSNTAATIIHVNPLPAVTANASANTVCAGTSVTLTGKGANTYSWTGGITNGVSFVPLQTNTYTLTGTDGNNCSDTDTTTITVNPFVTTASITASATTVCSGITIILTGTGAAAYLWSTGATAAAITISASGVYWLEDNSLQCSNKDSITITQIPTPTINLGNNITVCEGQTATLNGGVASSYLWSNGATTASITISTAGTYWLQANNGQCLDKDSLSVYFYDCEIEVPNVFTPNNDGVNDVFTITTKNITLLNCKIYNRWGTIVGELKNITDGWDGRTKSGVDCTEGVYYFIAEYKDSTGINNVKKGFLQLTR